MVQIPAPPPVVSPQPQYFIAASGTQFIRLYNPAWFNGSPVGFRFNGPRKRFDHQREVNGLPADDSERGILYAGNTVSGCVVEIFGDTRMIDVGTWEIGLFKPNRDLNLLDMRGDGAMRAGTVAAVCKDSNHNFSQIWSRYFYENPFLYQEIDGLIFGNAHNDETALALYERCHSDLKVVHCGKLADPALRSRLQIIAGQLGFTISPY